MDHDRAWMMELPELIARLRQQAPPREDGFLGFLDLNHPLGLMRLNLFECVCDQGCGCWIEIDGASHDFGSMQEALMWVDTHNRAN